MVESQNINGSLFANYSVKFNLDTEWNRLTPSIEFNSDMELTNGELLDIKSLNALKTYTKIDDFSYIQFSSLKNSISISNSKIIIPNMEVNSNTMNIQLSGSHYFDNSYEYHFVILLSEVLGKKHKKNLNNEFGEIEDDGYGRSKLHLTLTGKGEDFDVKYDRSGLGQKLQYDLKEEKSSLKEALNKEFGWFKSIESDSTAANQSPSKPKKSAKEKNKEMEQRQDEGEFIIEWDEEG